MAAERESSAEVEALVRRAAAGEAAAQAELLGRYRYVIRRAVRARLGGALRAREETADLEQEVALRVLTSLGKQQWRGRSAFLAWLKQLALGEVIDRVRYHAAARRAVAAEVELEEDAVAQAKRSPESLMDEQARLHELERRLEALPDKQALAVMLFHQGHSHAEIGAVLGCSEEAARKQVARGRARLVTTATPEKNPRR